MKNKIYEQNIRNLTESRVYVLTNPGQICSPECEAGDEGEVTERYDVVLRLEESKN